VRCRAPPLVRFQFAAGADPGSRSKAFLPDDRRALDAPLTSIITTEVEVASAKGCGRPSAPVRRDLQTVPGLFWGHSHRFDDIRVTSAYHPDSGGIADVAARRICATHGSLRLFQEHAKWCNLQSASCQWDMPKSRKLRTAPVPSAGKHCAIHSILGLRALDRCACPHRYTFRRTTAQTVKSGAKGIDGDVSD
jgi:hypothetical protein